VLYVRRTFYRLLNIEVVPNLLFALHTQHTVVHNNTGRRLRQADVDKNLTQRFKRIKFYFLPTTKMKKTVSHITVLVKLIKLSHFNIIHNYRHDKCNYTKQYKSNLITVLSFRVSFKRTPHTDR